MNEKIPNPQDCQSVSASDLCSTCHRPFDAPEHHPDLIVLSAQDGGERAAATLAERIDGGSWADYSEDERQDWRGHAVAALAARPAPVADGVHNYIVQEDDWRECSRCGHRYQRWEPGREPVPSSPPCRPAPVVSGAVHDAQVAAQALRDAVRAAKSAAYRAICTHPSVTVAQWSALGAALDREFDALTVADAPATEPEYPKPCSNCGALYSTCTERIRAGRRACCGTCGYTATHDQNAWEAWDRQRTHVPAADDEGGRE